MERNPYYRADMLEVQSAATHRPSRFEVMAELQQELLREIGTTVSSVHDASYDTLLANANARYNDLHGSGKYNEMKTLAACIEAVEQRLLDQRALSPREVTHLKLAFIETAARATLAYLLSQPSVLMSQAETREEFIGQMHGVITGSTGIEYTRIGIGRVMMNANPDYFVGDELVHDRVIQLLDEYR